METLTLKTTTCGTSLLINKDTYDVFKVNETTGIKHIGNVITCNNMELLLELPVSTKLSPETIELMITTHKGFKAAITKDLEKMVENIFRNLTEFETAQSRLRNM